MANEDQGGISRRLFLQGLGSAGTLLGVAGMAGQATAEEVPKDAEGKVIPGFEKGQADPDAAKKWQPFSDRKLRVGIAGYGLCSFGAQFGFQNHPNVEVVAVSDLIPSRCAELAKACRCEKSYPSCEEMIEDDRIEAVFIATGSGLTVAGVASTPTQSLSSSAATLSIRPTTGTPAPATATSRARALEVLQAITSTPTCCCRSQATTSAAMARISATLRWP